MRPVFKMYEQDFLTRAGSLPEDQNGAASRSLGLPKRRVPTKWWRICSKGPGNTGLCPWTAAGKGPSTPGNTTWETTALCFTQSRFLYPWSPSAHIIVAAFPDPGLLWWRVQAWHSSRRVGICCWREASVQQPTGCESTTARAFVLRAFAAL